MPDLRTAWQSCLEPCPPGQQLYSFDWFQTWLSTYGRLAPWTGRIVIVTAVNQEGRTCAIMPLAHRRQKGLSVLSLAGLYQPVRSFVCDPGMASDVCSKMLSALQETVKDWDVLRFTPIDDATPERVALIEALSANDLALVQFPLGRTIVNTLKTSIEDYASTHAMKRMHYYERRMLREGDAKFKHLSNPDPSTLRGVLNELKTIEANSWLAEAGGDLRFATSMDHDYWMQVAASSLVPAGQLDIWIAYMKDAPVAFRFVITTGDTSYLLSNQYDAAYAKMSPGWVLFRHNLEFAIQHGIRCIDSAPGDLHYKSRLGGEEAHMRLDVLAFRSSLKGKTLAAGIRCLHATREKLNATGWGKRVARYLPRI